MAAVSEQNLTGNNSTNEVSYPGGTGSLTAHGTWGGGTLTLEFSPDEGTTWFGINDVNGNAATLSDDGHVLFNVMNGQIRATLSGATSPDINVSIRGHYYPNAN